MGQKIVTAILCASIVLALMIQFYCTKMDETSEKIGVKSETQSKTDPTAAKSQSAATEENSSVYRGSILPTNKYEKPLAAKVGTTKDSSDNPVSILSGGPYTCGSSMNGSYYGSGYYRYPDYTFDLSSTLNGSVISLNVYSYDVPNRFDVRDASGNLVVSSGWMGYATYSGPWGTSLNAPQNKILTFIRNKSTYYLRVETSTQNYSDAWDASFNCSVSPITSFKNSPRYISLQSFCSTFGTLMADNGSVYYFDDDTSKPWIYMPVVNNSAVVGYLKVVRVANAKVSTVGRDYLAAFVRYEDGFTESNGTGIVSIYDLDDQNQMIGRFRFVNGTPTEDILDAGKKHYCDRNGDGNVTYSECMTCMTKACFSNTECGVQCVIYNIFGGLCNRAFRDACVVISIIY